MLLARQGNVDGHVKEKEVGDAVDAGNHAVDDEQVPPRPSPTLLEHGDALAVERRKRPRVEVNLESQALYVAQDGARLFLLAAAVEADDEQHHGLHHEAIARR